MSERREYGLLSKRSKQILGQDVLPKRRETAPSAKVPTKSEDAQQEKRRNQVLQAQRTHRQRTQNYIKMLEREVLRLRESERVALEKAQNLQDRLNALLSGQPGPGGPGTEAGEEGGPQEHLVLGASTATSDNSASYGLVTANLGGEQGVYVNVAFPRRSTSLDPPPRALGSNLSSHLSSLSVSNSSVTASSTASNPASNPALNLPSSNITAAALPSPSARLSGAILADPQVGIEFVLGLETDCMDHLRGRHLDHVHERIIDPESDISGHVSTACLSLWQQHTANLSTSASYEISNAELERLLSTSLNLGLQPPEVTPVQIWNRIRWLQLAGGKQALERLTNELKAQVFCVGFGAVLDDSIVEEILQRHFSQLPVGY